MAHVCVIDSASVFDLLPHLVKGDNVLTFELGNGWSSSAGGQPGAAVQPPSLFVNGTVTLQGGATIALRSGGSGWTSNVGAATFDSVFTVSTAISDKVLAQNGSR